MARRVVKLFRPWTFRQRSSGFADVTRLVVWNFAGRGILLAMPKYKVTLRNGTSSDRTFDSDFQAINQTHRPTASQAGIVQITRYEEGGGVIDVWSDAATGRVSRC